MKIIAAIYLLLCIVPSYAHIGDKIYPIYEMDPSRIDLRDVSIADWEDYVGLPSLVATDFYQDPTVGEGAQYDPTDLDYRIWLGWSVQGTGRLYVAMERIDNVYVNKYHGGDFGQFWRFDSIEFMVDGDHTGGDYTGFADQNWTDDEKLLNNNRTAQQYVAIADTPDGRHVGYLGAGAEWVNAPPYADGGGGSVGEGPTTSIFEFYVTPFDDLIYNDPDGSTPTDLTEALAGEKIIGFQITVPDFDVEPSAYRAFHTLTGQAATWRYAWRFADARLIVTGESSAVDLTVSSHPERRQWYADRSVSFSWTAPDVDYDYFAYLVQPIDDSGDVERDGQVTTDLSASTEVSADGPYLVRVGYQAGNDFTILATSSFRVDTSVEAPSLSLLGRQVEPRSGTVDASSTLVPAVDSLLVDFIYPSSDLSGYAGLFYSVDQSPTSRPSTLNGLTVVDSAGVLGAYGVRFPTLVNGRNYVHVLTRDQAGNERLSHYRLDVDLEPPGLVSGAVARGFPSGDVVLSWDEVPDAANYRIYRTTRVGSLGSLIEEAHNSTSYRDYARENGGTLLADLEYFYTVRAVDGAGNENTSPLNAQVGSQSSLPVPPEETVSFEVSGLAAAGRSFSLGITGAFSDVLGGSRLSYVGQSISDSLITVLLETSWVELGGQATWGVMVPLSGLLEGSYRVRVLVNEAVLLAEYDLSVLGVPGFVPSSLEVVYRPRVITSSDELSLSVQGALPSDEASVSSALVSLSSDQLVVDLTTSWVVSSGSSSASYDTTLSVGPLSAGSYAVVVRVDGEDVLIDSLTVLSGPPPEGPIRMDFNTRAGDQMQREAKGGVVGRTYEVELYATDAPLINGWNVVVAYDPAAVSYVGGSFAPSEFISGLLGLEDLSQAGIVAVGGTVLGSTASASGAGSLGQFSFVLADGFSGSTELQLIEYSFRQVEGEQIKGQVLHTVRITDAVELVGDGDGNGVVDFNDFFLFADAFGSTDARFDYDGSGSVDFGDFFLFADNFGKEAQAKLMAMAHEMIGLPKESGIVSTYPNPFNSAASIEYRVFLEGEYKLGVYNMTGQLVRELVSGVQVAGLHRSMWNGMDDKGRVASTGVYLVRLQGKGVRDVRKISLIR